MNKFSNILIVFLMVVVVLLGSAVYVLVQRDNSAVSSVSDQSVLTESDADSQGKEEKEDVPKEAEAELRCSVQMGALQIIRGEEFGVQEGDADDCEAYLEDGVYTISASTTRDMPVVVTVPEGVRFVRATLTASGGTLMAEDLDVQDLNATCEQGALQFSGSVDGNAAVEHLQGETVLRLSGSPSDFNYEIAYELGHVEIGDKSYAGAKGSKSIDNDSPKTLRVHCAMGSVGVLFPEEA